LQIILLDTRNFRSRLLVQEGQRPAGVGPYLPDADPDKTMLGEAQWRWLEGELKKPADLRIVVSSVQVLTSGHRWERWSALQLEHERLLKLLKTVNEKAVILLSGDRHLAAMYRDAAPGPLLFEVTSSSMNLPLRRTPADQPDMRIGEPYTKENFGSLQIDWQGGTVSFKLHSLDGTAIQNETITFR
jgi:alkaline phosphatase D